MKQEGALDPFLMQTASGITPLSHERIGVLCALRSQERGEVAAPALDRGERAGRDCTRYPGLKGDFVLIWRPLAGRPRTSGFHFDAGRLCVMLSRHRAHVSSRPSRRLPRARGAPSA